MGLSERVIDRTPEGVWDVVSDGWLHPLWMVGATAIHQVDDAWPAAGSRILHETGFWPVAVRETTEVLAAEPARRIGYRVKSWLLGEAEITLTLEPVRGGLPGHHRPPDDDRCADADPPVAAAAAHPPRLGDGDPRPARFPRRGTRRDHDMCVVAPGRTYDVVVVGAGPNGLVTANLLADRGWSVLLLEAQDTVGGAVRSSDDVRPGFIHDTFSAFYPFVGGVPRDAVPGPRGARRHAGGTPRRCSAPVPGRRVGAAARTTGT